MSSLSVANEGNLLATLAGSFSRCELDDFVWCCASLTDPGLDGLTGGLVELILVTYHNRKLLVPDVSLYVSLSIEYIIYGLSMDLGMDED